MTDRLLLEDGSSLLLKENSGTVALETPGRIVSVHKSEFFYSSSQSYVDINGALIGAASLVAGKKYLIVVNGSIDSPFTNTAAFIQLVHGSTAFSESEHVEEGDASTTKTNYFYWTVWQAVTAEDLKLQIKSQFVSNQVEVGFGNFEITVISLEDGLVENVDWFLNETTTDTTLTNVESSSNNAAITFTPLVPSDTWLVLSTARQQCEDALISYISRLLRTGEVTETCSEEIQEPEENGHRFVQSQATVVSLGAVSNTFTEKSLLSGAGTIETRLGSSVFALNLSRFKSVGTRTLTKTDLSATDYATQLESVSLTPDFEGSVWSLANWIYDAQNEGNYCKGRLQVDNVDDPARQSTDAFAMQQVHDGRDQVAVTRQAASVQSAAAHTYDLDASTQAATSGRGGMYRALFAAAVEQLNAKVIVAGLAAVAAIGTPTVRVDCTVIPTGLQATAAIGSVTVLTGQVIIPTGLAATAAIGSPTVLGTTIAAPTGQVATAAVGTVIAKSNYTNIPTGLAGTGSIGAVTVSVTGTTFYDALIRVGDASKLLAPRFTAAINATPTPSGVQGTAAIGVVVISIVPDVATQDVLIRRGPTPLLRAPAFTITPLLILPNGAQAVGQIGVVTIATINGGVAVPGLQGIADISGIVEQDAVLYPIGVQATASVGAVTTSLVSVVQVLLGQVATGQIGTVLVHTDVTVVVVGVSALARIGSVATLLDSVLIVTPVIPVAVASIGTVVVVVDNTTTPVGSEATGRIGQVGTSVVGPGVLQSPYGLEGRAQVGNVTTKSDVLLTPAGLEGTAAVGELNALGIQQIQPTGLVATGAIGSVVVRVDVVVVPAGLQANARLGATSFVILQFDSVVIGVSGLVAQGQLGAITTIQAHQVIGLAAVARIGVANVVILGQQDVLVRVDGLEGLAGVGVLQIENDEGLATAFVFIDDGGDAIYECDISAVDEDFEFVEEASDIIQPPSLVAHGTIGAVTVVIGLEPNVDRATAEYGSLLIAHAITADKIIEVRDVSFAKRIDPATFVISGSFQTPTQGFATTYCPLTNRIYIAATQTIVIIDPLVGAVGSIELDTGETCYGVRYSNYTQKVYASGFSGKLYTINPLTETVESSIVFSGKALRCIAVSHKNQKLWITAHSAVIVYDPLTQVRDDITFGPQDLLGVEYAPPSQKMFVSGFTQNVVYSISSDLLVATIPSFFEPSGIGYCPSNQKMYVTEQAQRVTVIDPLTDAVISRITGFVDKPAGIVYAASTGFLYVACVKTNTTVSCTVVDPATNNIIGQI